MTESKNKIIVVIVVLTLLAIAGGIGGFLIYWFGFHKKHKKCTTDSDCSGKKLCIDKKCNDPKTCDSSCKPPSICNPHTGSCSTPPPPPPTPWWQDTSICQENDTGFFSCPKMKLTANSFSAGPPITMTSTTQLTDCYKACVRQDHDLAWLNGKTCQCANLGVEATPAPQMNNSTGFGSTSSDDNYVIADTYNMNQYIH